MYQLKPNKSMQFNTLNHAIGALPRRLRKILLVMKITTLILLTTLLQLSAASFGQKVTIVKNNIAMTEVFKEIRKQTGYHVLWQPDKVDAAQKMNLQIRNQEIGKALDLVLAGQHLSYSIEDKTIRIKYEAPSFVERMIELLAAIDVSGKVLTEQGVPVQGATVMIKGGNRGTTTDKDGKFSLQDVDEKAVLVISSVGYLTKEINVKSDLGAIALEISNAKLDEVLVIGYGTTTKRLSTGSTTQVTGEDITKQPVSNPILALEGRVPGLFITQNAGYAGANTSVVIRGQNSLTFNSASPLYVIDGVPFSSSPVERSVGGFSFNSVGFSPLNTINPSDIESIDVLKDADATAIYGSRGANGVILITTRKGKKGNTKFGVEFSNGFGSITNNIPMLNTQQYLEVRRQAFINDGIEPTAENAPDLKLWDQNASTDFPDLLFGKTAHQTNAALSVSGGDDLTQFVFGGNFRKETSVFRSATADKAVQFRLSAQHKSKDNKFSSNVSVSYNVDDNTIPNYNITLANYSLPPNYPLYNPNGSLYFGPGYDSPLAGFNATNNLKTNNLNASGVIGYRLLPGLEIKTTGGYNLINVDGTMLTPSTASNPANNYSQIATLNNNYIKTYILEPQVTYNYTIGKSRFNALAGGTWQQTQNVQPYFLLGSFTDIRLAKSLGALSLFAKSSGYTDFRYASAYGRLEYNYDGKYLLSGNLRRDGSSRFGQANRWGTFGSAAAAWIFSKESLIEENLPWLSFGKLRASFGTIGNDKIPDYAYVSNYYSGSGYGSYSTLTPGGIANPYLKWEQTKKLDIALELGFIKDRILLTANVYRNRSSNLLGTTPLPDQTGFSEYYTNFPAKVQNKGLELELATVNVKNQQLTWNTSFNFTAPRNKLLSFPDLLNSTYANMYVVGQSLNLTTVFHSTGIVDGIPTVEDLDGDGQITGGIHANGNGDYIVAGNTDPKFYAGINNTFIYKGFQLDFLFQMTKRDATRGDLNFTTIPGQGFNLPESILDVGLKYTANYGTPAANAFYYFTNSDAAIEDATFVRLKNVSLAYNVPSDWTRRLRMSGLQLYVHGQNLLTFTGYKGLDPETLTTQLPPLKMFIAGLKATF
jgi:TonB-linked SusC/RagA family outer membrane protein